MRVMSGEMINRQAFSDGTVTLSAGACAFVYKRAEPGVLLVTISGLDSGQFGTATLDEIAAAMNREGPIELFIDAHAALGAAVRVSDDWTRFFNTHRRNLTRVHVLAGSRAVRLTVAIAQHFSQTGHLIQIYSDPAAFASRLAHARRRRGHRQNV